MLSIYGEPRSHLNLAYKITFIYVAISIYSIINASINLTKVSALVEWLEYPPPVREGPGSKPVRDKKTVFHIYSMDVVG